MLDDDRSVGQGSQMVTVYIIVVTVIAFILQRMHPELTDLLAMHSTEVRSGEVWRLASYMLMHDPTSIFHILFNMYVLFLFGRMVEARMGSRRYFGLYIFSGLVASFCWLIFNWELPNGMIGASGAVMGVMAAAGIFFPDQRVMLIIPPIPMKLRTMVICIIIAELFFEVSRSQTGVAHLAHLGGIFGAVVYLLAFYRRTISAKAVQLQRGQEYRRRSTPPEIMHRCEVCGATEKSLPNATFRVCSQCTGAKEYCDQHLPTHDHH